MPTKIATFSEAVRAQLARQNPACPSFEALHELFETMYFASMRTEEGHAITFHVVYLDPQNIDPFPPKRVRKDRWDVVGLRMAIPATVNNLVKLATASDPRTSSFAVFEQDRQMNVWGLVDQGNGYHDFVNYESDDGPDRPGIFQASILGIGRLAAFRGYQRLAELNVGQLMRKPIDVLSQGPVRAALDSFIEEHVGIVAKRINAEIPGIGVNLGPTIATDWIATLSRLLLRMQRYRHGGALLITPDDKKSHLNLKYEVDYRRLRNSLEDRTTNRIARDLTRRSISKDYIHRQADSVPRNLYLSYTRTSRDMEEANRALTSSLWFVSLLSRVDGLVLLTPRLDVHAFGVEITASEPPQILHRAKTSTAEEKKTESMQYEHFGTRHRSMMRYCNAVPGSVGFVVSQDGDVRAITKVGQRLLMWENVKLLLDDFKVLKRQIPGGPKANR